MAQRNGFLYGTLTFASLLMVVAIGCGDDGDGGDDDNRPGQGGDGGERPSGGGSGGTSGATSGGRSGAGPSTGGKQGSSGDTGDAGDSGAGIGGEGGSAGGGSLPAVADVADVIAAVCDWEFRCCDDGERQYRLSPFADDAADCAKRLVYEMRQSNGTDNPYESGPAAQTGLLGVLGYSVDLTRVEVNPEGAAECVASWKSRGCTEEPDAGAHCEGPGGTDPCALTNLFGPKLAIGAECTIALAETAGANDVECVAGSTCLPAAHADNPKDVPTCVKRGVADEPCTADDDCDFDFYCKDGDCAAKGDVGETCSFRDEEEPIPGEEDAKCKAGLACHPLELTCVESCTNGFTCVADQQCPEGSGCAPLEVAETIDEFNVCTRQGSTAAALCNTDGDCTENYHCDGANCQADRAASAACTAQNQCATGLHCDVGGTNTCVSNLAQMATCTQNYQCQPDSAGCLNAGTTRGRICRRTLLPLADTCGEDAACASGRCEVATGAAAEATCVSGAEKGDACDSLTTDGTALRCGPGLLCQGTPTSVSGGRCVDQADPGTSCDNEAGMPTAALCKNGGACADPWQEGNICTDAAVPKANGGTGLVCDGS